MLQAFLTSALDGS